MESPNDIGFLIPDEPQLEWRRYEELEIGHNISLNILNNVSYWKILNIEAIPWLSRTDSAWYIAANATRELGTINDWLEPGGDQIYVLRVGVYSDKEAWVVVRYTGTTGELFGINDDPLGRITASNSPYYAPRVIVKTFPNTIVTSFRLENRTRYTLSTFKLSIQGMKMRLEPMKTRPDRFTPISMTHVSEAGRGISPQSISTATGGE